MARRLILATAVALAASVFPLAAPASAKCTDEAVTLCTIASYVCYVIRENDPTGKLCPLYF